MFVVREYRSVSSETLRVDIGTGDGPEVERGGTVRALGEHEF